LIQTRTLSSGVQLVVEPSGAVQSCGLSWLAPGGSASDPTGAAGEGESALLAEFMLRGAGQWESRAHSDALDALGVDRRTAASTHHLVLNATLLSDHLLEALSLLAPIVTAPRLDASHLDAVKRLALQSLAGLQDEPQHLAMVRLSERFFPAPFNRSGYGHADGIRQASIEGLRTAWRKRVTPVGSILAIAGRVPIDPIVAVLEPLLAEWRGSAAPSVESAPALGGSVHVPQPTAQTHIVLGLWAPQESAPEALLHRMAVRIFGGETSSRLFTEVREKRGLCYSVGAGTSLGRDRGITSIYAGSTPDRAETTLSQIRAEITRFADGVTQNEFDRAVVAFKSRLVMQGESTSARAAALASDVHRVGRGRSLEELARDVDAISLEALDQYVKGTLASRWSAAPTLVTIGPRPINGA